MTKWRRINLILRKIQEGIKLNESTSSRTPMIIGMRVLGLKDRRTHQWVLGTLMRISDNQGLLNLAFDEQNPIGKCELYQLLPMSKFFVQFDDEEHNGVRNSESFLFNQGFEKDTVSVFYNQYNVCKVIKNHLMILRIGMNLIQEISKYNKILSLFFIKILFSKKFI